MVIGYFNIIGASGRRKTPSGGGDSVLGNEVQGGEEQIRLMQGGRRPEQALMLCPKAKTIGLEIKNTSGEWSSEG